MTSDGTYLAKTLLKKMVVIPRQFSHHSVFQRNYLRKILCRRTIYTSEGHRIAQFQDSALQNVKIVSSCHINPPLLPFPPRKKSVDKKYIYSYCGCVLEQLARYTMRCQESDFHLDQLFFFGYC